MACAASAWVRVRSRSLNKLPSTKVRRLSFNSCKQWARMQPPVSLHLHLYLIISTCEFTR